MQIQQRKLKIPGCSVEFSTSDVVEFSQFECLSSSAAAIRIRPYSITGNNMTQKGNFSLQELTLGWL